MTERKIGKRERKNAKKWKTYKKNKEKISYQSQNILKANLSSVRRNQKSKFEPTPALGTKINKVKQIKSPLGGRKNKGNKLFSRRIILIQFHLFLHQAIFFPLTLFLTYFLRIDKLPDISRRLKEKKERKN